MQALRGHDYDDYDFKKDMLDSSDINIPDHLLYKPQMNDWLLNEMHQRNSVGLQKVINPETGQKYTAGEAKAEADKLRSVANENLQSIMRVKD